jgi:hypothetical protein
MKKFLIKAALFSIPIILMVLAILFSIDGYRDPYYLRLTTPRQTSLILGTSRAAQGLQPQVINQHLRRSDLYNYAFTRNISPYGPTYLRSIKNKIDTLASSGVFIVTVDSWSVSSDSHDPDDSSSFEEVDSFLGQTQSVDVNPNIPYLSNFYEHPLRHLFSTNKQMLLHDDGWLEVSLDMKSVTQDDIDHKIDVYKQQIFPFYHYSATRYRYLGKTIEYLKQFGKVYIVRLPTHPKMMAIDDKLVPKLGKLLQDLSQTYQVPYLDLTPRNAAYQYIDGNHLYKDSGRVVSQEIADWISDI